MNEVTVAFHGSNETGESITGSIDRVTGDVEARTHQDCPFQISWASEKPRTFGDGILSRRKKSPRPRSQTCPRQHFLGRHRWVLRIAHDRARVFLAASLKGTHQIAMLPRLMRGNAE